jgi:type II secretory pathway component GspD/PulD (secretin)
MNNAVSGIFCGLLFAAMSYPVLAQTVQERAAPPVTLDLRDAPIRDALEKIFKNAKVDYLIDPGVAGFVTLKITEQPFENALRLILRSAQTPLIYTKESGVYIVKMRLLTTATPNPPPAAPAVKPTEQVYQPLETIQLVYVDPADLSAALGPITFIRTNVRGQAAGGGRGGFGSGGFGGGFGGGRGF